MGSKRDFKFVTIIGAAVGILIQPTFANILHGSRFLTAYLGTGTLTFGIRAGLFVFFSLLAPFALWAASLIGKFAPTIYQFAKFAAVGVLNTFIGFAVLNISANVTGATSGPLIPVFATLAFLVATTNSFFWNKFWTFEAKEKAHVAETAKFYLVAIIGWALYTGTASVVINYLAPQDVAPELWLNVGGLCGVAAAFLWDFFGYKYLVFKKGRG
jgi:putative flippase GtrA